MLDTLSAVKARIGITETTNDAFLTQQIGLVSDVIEAYCRRVFTSGGYTQTFYKTDYEPANIIEVFHFPLVTVTSVTEDSVVLNSSQYRIHKPTGRIIRPDGSFFLATETVVVYDAGFAVIPSPVLSVLDSIVLERYNKKTSGVDLNFGSDVQRISVPGSISIDFDYTLTNNDRKSTFGSILGNNINILDPYRSNRAIVGESKITYVEEAP